MKKYILDKNIDIDDFDYIKNWLYDDYIERNDGTGFYCNLDIINKSIQNKGALVFRKNRLAEGILTFRTNGKLVEAEIIAINPKLRHQGFGKAFVESYLSYFKKKGIYCVKTTHVTKDGKRLCRSTNFKVLRGAYQGSHELLYHKILVETRKQNWTAKNRIVLWENEISGEGIPNYSWSLNFSKSKKPIIHYAFPDWHVGVMVNDEIVKCEKLKYLNNEASSTAHGFLFVNEKICNTLMKQVLTKRHT